MKTSARDEREAKLKLARCDRPISPFHLKWCSSSARLHAHLRSQTGTAAPFKVERLNSDKKLVKGANLSLLRQTEHYLHLLRKFSLSFSLLLSLSLSLFLSLFPSKAGPRRSSGRYGLMLGSDSGSKHCWKHRKVRMERRSEELCPY